VGVEERLWFPVRDATNLGVSLSGLGYQPHGPSKGNILFLQGISSDVNDCSHFLRELGEEYTVISFNYLGHENPGVLDAADAPRHAIAIREKFFDREPVILMGHSMGATIATAAIEQTQPQAIVLLAPLINKNYTRRSIERFISFVHVHPHLARAGDNILERWPIQKKVVPHLNNPLRAYASLGSIDMLAYTINTPAFYAMPDRDELFGVTPENIATHEAAVRQAYLLAESGNELVRGWNHCLNLKHLDLVPFFKEEPNKDRKPFLDALFKFLDAHR